MTVDPRAALDRFVAALEAHYAAILNRRGEHDESVDDAYDVLADAFDVYDEALGAMHAEATPFVLADEEDEEEEDSDELEDADDDERVGELDDDELDDGNFDGSLVN